jgi:chromosome segregation ATPase
MPSKAELTQAIAELEEEYRYWIVEAISIDRSLENLEEKIDSYEQELGAERVAEFRARLERTRERHASIEERMRYVRWRLHDLKTRLKSIPDPS